MRLPPARSTNAMLVGTAIALCAGGRFGRRAALRGAASAGAITIIGSVVTRATGHGSTDASRVAAATAFATGAALELPAAAAPIAVAIALPITTTLRDTRSRAPMAAAAAAGAGAALLSRRPWPVAPHAPAEVRRSLRRSAITPRPDGTGLTFIVNSAAGPALGKDAAAAIREGFPGAEVIELEDGRELAWVLAEQQADDGVAALGIAGGDGSVSAAGQRALEMGVPLVIVPAGTLNHLARDLGLTDIDDAVAAVRRGQVVEIDVAELGGRSFLNTAAFGAYPDLVVARERLESTIGKWPAVLIALAQVLRRAEPISVELDGEPRRVWMVFIGNCRYHPSGFAPGWRERLDDGQLDVRILDASRPLARVRLLIAVLSGRLGRSQVYEQHLVQTLSVRSADGPLRVALDGEVQHAHDQFVVRKRPGRLAVFVPCS